MGIQAFTEKSFGKFTEIFRITCITLKKTIESSAFYSEKFFKFSRTRFRKCLYSQLLNSSINFIELFFFVQGIKTDTIQFRFNNRILFNTFESFSKKFRRLDCKSKNGIQSHWNISMLFSPPLLIGKLTSH